MNGIRIIIITWLPLSSHFDSTTLRIIPVLRVMNMHLMSLVQQYDEALSIEQSSNKQFVDEQMWCTLIFRRIQYILIIR